MAKVNQNEFKLPLSREQRVQRRRRIAHAVTEEGMTVKQAARDFNVSVTTVRKACEANGAPIGRARDARLTHKERRERRRQIAQAVSDENLAANQAAERFHVSSSVVRMACAENNVRPRPSLDAFAPGQALEIVAALAEGKSVLEIASERHRSHQRIYQVKLAAEEAMLLPKLRRLGAELAELRRLRAKADEVEMKLARRRDQIAPQVKADVRRASATFAACLRKHRLAAGLTQRQAAALCGTTDITWSNYEVGRSKNPRLNLMIAMAAALHVQVTDLLSNS